MVLEKNTNKRIFIIDGYALLYRSHFALIRNPLITSYGLDTSALFGFINQTLKLIRRENPDFLVCAFDSKGKNFRHEMYDLYKANRSEMPVELQNQLPHLWESLDALKIPIIKKKGFEADDIIGTLVTEAEKTGLLSYIVSGDKDFMQLINDRVFLYAPGNRKSPDPIIYDTKKVEERWGVPPQKITDLLGLMGDSSDNVPGVSGIGEKTAVKLIKKYGSLEGALANAESVKNKRAQNGLKEGHENAILSKKLVTILTDVNLNVNVLDYKKNNISLSDCKKKFSELEFHAILKQLKNREEASNSTNEKDFKKDYKIILNNDALNQLISVLHDSDLIAFDLVTTSTVPMEAEIIGISFSVKEHEGYYIPLRYPEKEKNNFGEDDEKIVFDKLSKLFEDQSKLKTAQNIKSNSLILKKFGIYIEGIHFDTMVAAHLINPSAKSISLDTLSIEYFNHEMVPILDLIGRGKNQINLDEVPLEKVAYYASEYSDISLQLTNILKFKLKEKELFTYFNTIELPLLKVLTQMEFIGTFVDVNLLKTMSKKISDKLDSITSSIYALSGKEFNINSTQQLAAILFDELELPKIKNRSTAETVLKKLGIYHELPKQILDYRKYFKLKNTYLDSLQKLVLKDTGRIHSTFNQTIAATGRLSSTNPNFQNIPIRREEGKEIRRAFRAEKKDWKIFSFDYSQIELRIMAHYSKDDSMLEAFVNNKDIHSQTASNIFNVPTDNVLPEMRRTAKIVNFGIMYGAGPFRLSQELGIPRKEASLIINKYFEQYPGIKNYINDTIDSATKKKYVKTIFGRKRSIWDIDSENGIRKKAAERMAINMPIQGSAAEMIKVAMIAIHEEIKNKSMKSKMILQIHDELIFECPFEEEDQL
ncbi:DNA polymerase I, partial [Candidatus Marinimicrobia bacterium]|nr:DNA polymerase I [Candidatus Neomarinimicrobiota bacterium]